MTKSLEKLDRGLRVLREIAIAYRSPREPASEGIGVMVDVFWNAQSYIVSIERFVDDGGYGHKLSREELAFETLQAAMDEIIKQGFKIEQLKLCPVPGMTPG